MKITKSSKIFEEVVTLGEDGTDFVTLTTTNGLTRLELHLPEYTLDELEKILKIAQEVHLERLITWAKMNSDELDWPEDNRMDIIGQNGNNGDHYEKI